MHRFLVVVFASSAAFIFVSWPVHADVKIGFHAPTKGFAGTDGASAQIVAEPKVLLVDELSLGLMPKMIDLCLETISRLKDDGLAIVLVEQNTDRTLDIADQVVILSSGRIVGAGTPTEIHGEEKFFGTYLGLDTADGGGRSGPREQ